MFKKSLMISLFVGSFLTLVNQFDAIFGDLKFSIPSAFVTYTVPFFVSIYSRLSALKK